MDSKETRLRPPPAERFAGDSHVFDLNRALRDLRAEAHAALSGHRQVTIFRRAPVTQILFAFDPAGELADHAANGLVTIQAVDGRLAVRVAEQTHELEAGMIVVLSPGVPHSVRALDRAAMLLTVHLEKDDG